MMRNMHGPEKPAAMVNKVLQPEQEILCKQQCQPIGYRVPVKCNVVLIEKTKYCEPNERAQQEIYTCVSGIHINIYQCFPPRIEVQFKGIAQYYFKWNEDEIDR